MELTSISQLLAPGGFSQYLLCSWGEALGDKSIEGVADAHPKPHAPSGAEAGETEMGAIDTVLSAKRGGDKLKF